jgi:citrate lyase subunit beta / citryl-CoA lyase
MIDVRPRRSALYLPASNARAIDKAASLASDVIIFDLEDAVAPEEKVKARTQACRAVAAHNFGEKELVIRVNGIGTSWYDDDLRCSVEAAADAILLPKVENLAQVHAALQVLHAAEKRRRPKLWCMLETPRGILASDQIAGADENLDCLVMGTSDLTYELHALHTATRLPLLASLGLCLLAARAHGKCILDGVSLDLLAEDAFRDACQQGRELGFDGKTLIHPRQIAPCNAAFSPPDAEVTRARAILDAFAAARAEGHGVAVLDGRLIEDLHVREAERTLALDAALRAKNPKST